MNFSNIKSIEIPQGVVKQITTSQGVVLWQAQTGPTDYSKRYLTLVARDSGTLQFNGTTDGTTTNEIQYSTDNGQTWSTAAQSVTVNVSNGDKVLWKGEMTPYTTSPNYGIGNFTNSTATFDIEGNPMSLIYGDNFKTSLTGRNYEFYNLFNNTKCVNAENLILTTLASYCYYYMFQGCTSLTTVPELSATTLGVRCYTSMFYGCTSLRTAPFLPATELQTGAYNAMFMNCNNLNYIKMLGLSASSSKTYNWVNGVSATGIFVKNITATWTETGSDGVPTGWTVIYYDTTEDKYYLDQQKSQECDDHGNAI